MGNKPATIQSQLKKLTLVSGDNSGKIRYWQDGKLKAEIDAHAARVRSLIKLDATRLISASFDKTIKIWHVNDKKCLHEIQAHNDDINGIALLGNDKLVSVSDDKTIKLWDLNKQTVIQSITHQTRVYSVHASKENLFVAGNYLSTAEVYDVNSGKAVKVFQGHENAISRYALLPVLDKFCVSGGLDGTIRIYNDFSQVKRLDVPSAPGVFALAAF